MAKVQERGASDPLMRPVVQLRACIICAMPAAWKYDTKQRPYLYCPHCGTRIFFHTAIGIAGAEQVHELILRSQPVRWHQRVQERVRRRMAGMR